MFKLCCHTCEIRRYLSCPTPSHSIQTPDLAARTIHDSELLLGCFTIYCNDSSGENNSKEGGGKVMQESFYRICYCWPSGILDFVLDQWRAEEFLDFVLDEWRNGEVLHFVLDQWLDGMVLDFVNNVL